MIVTTPQTRREFGTPARTSILVAAARAFGSREPDESVRNPDLLADRLIGPDELRLITDHPLSEAIEQSYAEASQNPAILGIVWLMLVRTRFIDEALERAVKNRATQVVILGAGFDSRAHRFRELLRNCRVIEVDAASTQEYKKGRVAVALPDSPPNLTYSTVDFATGDLRDALLRAGFQASEKTFYIWEGVSMYLPEHSVRKTLQTITLASAPGSSVVLDYVNHLGIEYGQSTPQGPAEYRQHGKNRGSSECRIAMAVYSFRELGFDPGLPLATTSPEAIARYATSNDGTTYGARVFNKMRAELQARAPQQPSPPLMGSKTLNLRKAIAQAGGVYCLAELVVGNFPKTDDH